MEVQHLITDGSIDYYSLTGNNGNVLKETVAPNMIFVINVNESILDDTERYTNTSFHWQMFINCKQDYVVLFTQEMKQVCQACHCYVGTTIESNVVICGFHNV